MAAKPTAYVSKLVFSGGDSVTLNRNEKIIVVGPNNSGKSQSLREILTRCQSVRSEPTLVVAEVEVTKTGGLEDLRDFLDEHAEVIKSHYRYRDWQIHQDHLQFWTHPNLPHQLSAGFIRKIAAEDRLSVCELQNSIAPGEQKTKPQQVLYDDQALMTRISALFRRAFGKDLMFDFRGGSRLPIHVGELPSAGGDRVGDAYVNAVRTNPLLHLQGDGMKSYAGILFEAVVANRDVTLIDEPEAFLHPPQMRRLGETLASEVGGQLIVATHSSEILRGFLEATKGGLRILRIRRERDVNFVTEATPETVRELWERPELRYSNGLEGIFHEQAIICEDDSDCRLINAIADHLAARSSRQWQDTAYVPTGGKHGVPKIASVLRKIGVPVKVVFDIDFLAERELVRATVEAFGGDWLATEKLWGIVDAAVRNGVAAKNNDHIKQEVIAILNSANSGDLPKGDVIEAMKQGKPWAEVKKYGVRGLPRGEVQQQYAQLRDTLEAIGIFLVPVGEIENFAPEIGSHGPKFVSKLLASLPLGDEKLGELHAFVDKVHAGAHAPLG